MSDHSSNLTGTCVKRLYELEDAKALIEILELEKTVYARRLKCLGKRYDLALRQLKREREKS